ncbi:MAG: UPF0489 family protein, partial [Candidatus Omnitrophota bacterium]
MSKINITTIEDHHEAYFFWKKKGFQSCPLVHFDAHIDFNYHKIKPYNEIFAAARTKNEIINQTISKIMFDKFKGKEKDLINIGNYIYSAMRDGIVSDFYWVIPGGRKQFNLFKDTIVRVLDGLSRRDPFRQEKILSKEGLIEKKIYGHRFIVTTLEDLPVVKNALCDIDVDYLTT